MFDKLDTKLFQIHLNGPGMSGRGVRFKQLLPSQQRASNAVALSKVPKDGTAYDYVHARLFEGAKSFLLEVTKGFDLKTLTPGPHDPPVEWIKLSARDLEPAGICDLNSGEIFTALDVECLQALYRTYHEPSQELVSTILGEQKSLA